MTSHVDSNMEGKDGTETITNFATIGDSSAALVGATVTSSGAVAGTIVTGSTGVIGTTYVKAGSLYILSGEVTANSASVLAAVVAVTGAPVPMGSIFLNASPAAIWLFTATMTAATIT